MYTYLTSDQAPFNKSEIGRLTLAMVKCNFDKTCFTMNKFVMLNDNKNLSEGDHV